MNATQNFFDMDAQQINADIRAFANFDRHNLQTLLELS